MPDFTASITVDAPVGDVYALVSDLPRMGEWSPECTRVSWSGSSAASSSAAASAAGAASAAAGTALPSVGARFVGHNRAGVIRWFTQGEVIEATPGERFAFRIHFGPVPIAVWAYTFTPTESGCVVAESWTDRRPAALRRTFGWIFGDRHQRNQHGIRTTLARLKTASEATR